jgi:processive 1,2-diacylglycerol beta-glucosyltransferase
VGAALVAEIAADTRPPLAAVLTAFSVRQGWIHPGCDLYFVATDEVREDLVMAGIDYSKVMVSGVPSPGAAGGDPAPVTQGSAGRSDRFSVVMGGAGQSDVDVRAVSASLADAGIQVTVASARDDRVSRQIAQLSQARPLVTLCDSQDNAVVTRAHAVLTRAGSALLIDALNCGVPSVLYNPIAAQEMANADYLVNSGASFASRDDDDLVEKVRFLASHPVRLEEMRSCAAGVGRNNASKTVVERCMALVR